MDNVVGYPKTQFQPLNSDDSSGIEPCLPFEQLAWCSGKNTSPGAGGMETRIRRWNNCP